MISLELLARLFIFLSMLVINLITTDRLATGKYSKFKIIITLTLYTVFLYAVLFLIRSRLGIPYIDGKYLILIGLSYIVPLKYLYQERTEKIIVIMSFSWLHTLTVTSLALNLSAALMDKNIFITAFIGQSIIYVFTTPVVIRYVKNKFLYILQNIPDDMTKYLVGLGIAEYFLMSMIYLNPGEGLTLQWKILAGFLIIAIAGFGNHFIYLIVKNQVRINYFRGLAYSDTLTGIKNRLALFFDSEKLISDNVPFTLVFMDLDKLKSINDTYGHNVGDDYLRQFTAALEKIVGNRGELYRVSGDEFVCILTGNEAKRVVSNINKDVASFFNKDVPFLGVSTGTAKFPGDASSLDCLIQIADGRMYDIKAD